MSKSIYNPLNLNPLVHIDYDDMSDHEPISHCGVEPWNQGKSGVYSGETLKRMGESLKGRMSPMQGKKHTEETKKKISESLKGNINHFIPHTEETKKKMSEAHKGHKHLEETKKKISKARMGVKRAPYKTKRINNDEHSNFEY